MEELTGEQEVYQPKKINGYDGIYNRLEGALHPGKMMQTLLNEVTKSGTAVRWNTEVENITENETAHIKNGITLDASQLLVATNGFTRRLLPDLPVKPARGLVMVSEPWPDMPFSRDSILQYMLRRGIDC